MGGHTIYISGGFGNHGNKHNISMIIDTVNRNVHMNNMTLELRCGGARGRGHRIVKALQIMYFHTVPVQTKT